MCVCVCVCRVRVVDLFPVLISVLKNCSPSTTCIYGAHVTHCACDHGSGFRFKRIGIENVSDTQSLLYFTEVRG